jgi:hypothetical protein
LGQLTVLKGLEEEDHLPLVEIACDAAECGVGFEAGDSCVVQEFVEGSEACEDHNCA